MIRVEIITFNMYYFTLSRYFWLFFGSFGLVVLLRTSLLQLLFNMFSSFDEDNKKNNIIKHETEIEGYI